MPADAPPAAPPPAGITIAPAPHIKSGLPSPTGVTIVQPPATDIGPIAPIKKGSAREKLMQDAQKIAKVDSSTNSARVTPQPQDQAPRPGAADPKPAAQPDPPADPAPGDAPPDPAADPAADPNPATAPDPKAGKPGKPNPWKLYEAEKAARAKAETEIQTLKSSIVPEQERTALTSRVEKAEKRAQELESHIRFVDYEKSAEFQEKYAEPYNQEWTRALTELKDLTLTGADNNPRPMQAEDLLELVNMNLTDAIKTAKAVFGDAADYVMQYRNEIRRKSDAQLAALDKARKEGADYFTRQKEAAEKWHTETSAQIKQVWDKENAAALSDPNVGSYFQPREGDQEWNQALAKGFELVDRAFMGNPKDPKLTPEQRASVVRNHAAVRNRAAGWGPLKKENVKLKARVAEVEKILEGYKGTAPAAGGSAPASNGGVPSSARDRMHAELIKRAKQV